MCAIVLSIVNEDAEREVLVLPITHTARGRPDDAVEIPTPVKQRLGLDTERSWIVIRGERVCVAWPGSAPAPGARRVDDRIWRATAQFFAHVRDRSLARVEVAELSRYGPTRRRIVIGTEPSGLGTTFHESSSPIIP